jgi:hypothetical protein
VSPRSWCRPEPGPVKPTVVDKGWLLITVGLDVAGWLLGRKPPELERHIEDSLSVEQTLERLDHVVAQAGARRAEP